MDPGELIAYLDMSGWCGGFEDMGERWVSVRDGAREATLKASDAGVRDVARRWEQIVEYLSLGLTRISGVRSSRSGTQTRPNRSSGAPCQIACRRRKASRLHSRADAAGRSTSSGSPRPALPHLHRRECAEGRQTVDPNQLDAPSTGDGEGRLQLEVRYPNQKEPTSCS